MCECEVAQIPSSRAMRLYTVIIEVQITWLTLDSPTLYFHIRDKSTCP